MTGRERQGLVLALLMAIGASIAMVHGLTTLAGWLAVLGVALIISSTRRHR